MAIDLSGGEQQTEMSGGTGKRIPPYSIVLVRLEVKPPSNSSNSHSEDPNYFVSSKGLIMLDTYFEVVEGSYTGTKIKDMTTCPDFIQEKNLSSGEQTACRIGASTLRAMLDAARGIDPEAYDDWAVQQRQIDYWDDLNGLEFPIKVKYDKGRYMKVQSIITNDKDEYQEVMNGGEIITDEPIPAEPDSNNSADHPTRATPPRGSAQPPQRQTQPPQRQGGQQGGQRQQPPQRQQQQGQQRPQQGQRPPQRQQGGQQQRPQQQRPQQGGQRYSQQGEQQGNLQQQSGNTRAPQQNMQRGPASGVQGSTGSGVQSRAQNTGGVRAQNQNRAQGQQNGQAQQDYAQEQTYTDSTSGHQTNQAHYENDTQDFGTPDWAQPTVAADNGSEDFYANEEY